MRRAIFALAVVFGALGVMPAQAAGFLQDLFSEPQRAAPVVYHYAPAQPQMRFILDDGLRVSRRPNVVSKATLKARQIAVQRRIAKKKAAALRLRQKVAARHLAIAGAQVPGGRSAASGSAASLPPAICCKNGEDPAKMIHSDTTLRVGDAYMTPQGLRIYRGRGAGAAQSAAFVDYRKAGIAQEMKSRLAALEDRRMRGGMPSAVGAPVKAQGAPAKSQAATLPHQVAAPSRAATGIEPGATATPKVRTALDPAGRVIRVVGP